MRLSCKQVTYMSFVQAPYFDQFCLKDESSLAPAAIMTYVTQQSNIFYAFFPQRKAVFEKTRLKIKDQSHREQVFFGFKGNGALIKCTFMPLFMHLYIHLNFHRKIYFVRVMSKFECNAFLWTLGEIFVF